MLYPIQTKTRIRTDLSGIWDFTLGNLVESSDLNLTTIAVPASFNEQKASNEIRNHIGDVSYKREFSIPEMLKNERLFLRFGSVTHKATVYLNNYCLGVHKGGFTPFEFEITDIAKTGNNILIVIVNNILDHTTLPVGNYSEQIIENKTIKKVDENFDFYNYAGIHRPVVIYSTPKQRIEDITITSEVNLSNNSAMVNIDVLADDSEGKIEILDDKNTLIASSNNLHSNIMLNDVKLWNVLNPYLYKCKVTLSSGDEYVESFGIRKIDIKSDGFYINGKRVYLKGFGKHEDFHLIGRGLNETLNVADIALMKSMGANSLRTSHYPYSEEMMRLCDSEGILVIDEFTAVGLIEGFGFSLEGMDSSKTWKVMKTDEAHKQVIRETILRDKNHACVIMWAVANEPASHEDGAYEYFKDKFDLVRELDPQNRPCTFVNFMLALPEEDKVAKLCDVICLNRYYGWYLNLSDLDCAKKTMENELERWHMMYPNIPIVFTEYGADTVSGMHSVYDIPFTEDYQIKFYKMYSEIFDKYDYVVGEQLWNFADFQTKNGIQRVDGNKKGVFTRERNPKAVYWYLKHRWENIK